MMNSGSEEDRGAESAGRFARLGMALADWSEQWFPDAFVFALVALILIALAGLAVGTALRDMIRYFGEGFWSIIPFTMQTAISIIGGYIVATSPPVYRLIRWLARVPRTPRGAVAFVAFFSTVTALLSYGLCMIFSGVLARETVRNVRGVDYRAIGAAAYVGAGSVWALGIASSATLLMATPSALPPSLLNISGVIPMSRTVFTWQSLTMAAILMCSSVLVAYLSAPAHSTKTVESFGVTEGFDLGVLPTRQTPAEWLEYAPVLSVAVGAMGITYIGQILAARGPLAALDLTTYNLLFLMLGLVLHWRPRSFTRAVNDSVPATAGVLIQFPFYGAIFGIITMSAIAGKMARAFVHISTRNSYPVLVSLYSGAVGVFVPSGGSKWIIEAPYVLQAAKDLHVNLGWVVQIYNAAESLPNLVNPFFMLPILGILKVRARDLVGYSLVQLMVNIGWVLFLTWSLARTFE